MGRARKPVLNRRDAYLLRILGQRRYLTMRMLYRLFFEIDGRTLRTAQNCVSRLLQLGYIDRCMFIPLKGFMGRVGRTPFVYWLTPAGNRLVESMYEGEGISLPPGRGSGGNDPLIEHTLATNALWVSLVLSWRAGGALVAVRWLDEWRGGMLDLGKFKFRPDAFVSLLVALQGAVPPLEAPRASIVYSRWETVEDWDTMFPTPAPARRNGGGANVQVLDLPCFVEADQGKSSRAQLRSMAARYRFVKKRSEWIEHYKVPMVGEGAARRAVWPMLLVLSRTERRMETLGKVLGDEKEGYPGLILLACGEWDQEDVGAAEGPVWWDVRGKRRHLTLVEALRGM